jgi:uncharacterized membrane protein
MRNSVSFKLFLIMALAGLLRFLGLGVKQLWMDEIIQVLHSRPVAFKEILAGVAQDRGGAPLDYLIQHFFLAHSFGTVEWNARFHAALFGVLSVLLIFIVCRELFNDSRLSLMCALLLCFYPFHHHYSQEGRPYSLFLFLTLILYFLLFRSLKNNSGRLWIIFTIVATFAFYANAYTAIVLASQLIFLIYHYCRQHEVDRDALRRGGCFILSATLAAAAYLPWQEYSFSNAKGNTPPEINFRLILQMIKGLGDGSYPLAGILILLAATGIYALIKMKRQIELGALLIWFVVPLPIIMSILAWRNYFFAERQLLFISPALLILAGAGINHLKQKVAHKFFLPEALLILISLVVIVLHYPDRRDDLRSTGLYLKENIQVTDAIVAPNLTGLLSFYFPDIYAYSADDKKVRELIQSPQLSRVVYIDSGLNRSRGDLDVLLAGAGKSEVVGFRGITMWLLQIRKQPPVRGH